MLRLGILSAVVVKGQNVLEHVVDLLSDVEALLDWLVEGVLKQIRQTALHHMLHLHLWQGVVRLRLVHLLLSLILEQTHQGPFDGLWRCSLPASRDVHIGLFKLEQRLLARAIVYSWRLVLLGDVVLRVTA